MRTITAHLIVFFALFALSLTVAACAGTISKCKDPAQRNTVECAVVNSVVDCTTPEASTLISEFSPIVEDWIVAKYTGADGTIDWSKAGEQLKSAGIADGMCVLASVVQKLSGKSTAEGGPGRPKAESLTVGFDTLRAKLAPGVQFKTAQGTL